MSRTALATAIIIACIFAVASILVANDTIPLEALIVASVVAVLVVYLARPVVTFTASRIAGGLSSMRDAFLSPVQKRLTELDDKIQAQEVLVRSIQIRLARESNDHRKDADLTKLEKKLERKIRAQGKIVRSMQVQLAKESNDHKEDADV